MNAQRFKADVDEALNVLWAFNHVMANGPSPPRDSELPFGQGRIKNALVYIYAAIHRDSVRAVIQQQYDAESASLFLSDQFRKAIVSHLTHLPKFRPDAEAAVVAWVRSLQVPLPPGPPETLTERLAKSAEEMQVRATAPGKTEDEIFRIIGQWAAIEQRAYEEGNAYLDEAQKFDRF